MPFQDAFATTLSDVLARTRGLIETGGPVVAILLLMAVFATAIILVKIWHFHHARLGQRKVAEEVVRLYQARQAPLALALAGRTRNPVAQLLAHAIRDLSRGRDEANTREDVTRAAADVLEALRGWLRPLEIIAALAPLLGLFGTVLGMIEAFRNLADAGSRVDPSVLSGGIWEALLTTAVGLAVAIPTVIAFNWLERRVERVGHQIESLLTRVFVEDRQPHDLKLHHQPAPQNVLAAAQ